VKEIFSVGLPNQLQISEILIKFDNFFFSKTTAHQCRKYVIRFVKINIGPENQLHIVWLWWMWGRVGKTLIIYEPIGSQTSCAQFWNPECCGYPKLCIVFL